VGVWQVTPAIEITGFHFENKKFSLEVGNFARMKQGGKNIGRVTVRISIEDNNSGDRVFDQSQDMICEKEVLAMHIDFPKLGAGIYTLAVEARDLFTGQQASKDQTVQVE